MRLRAAFAITGLVACGSFAAADGSGAGMDAGMDAAAPPEAGVSDSTGPVFALPADAACDASRVCFDFESPAQQTRPFGFDDVEVEIDGGLVLGDGFLSPNALKARSVDSSRSQGEISLPAVPVALRVRMKVRCDELVDNGGSSSHFLVFVCEGGEILAAKMALDGDFAIQVGGAGNAMGKLTVGAWIPFDAVVTYGTSSHTLTLTRFDTNETDTVTAPQGCRAPIKMKFGSDVTSGNGAVTVSMDDIAIDWN